MTREEHIEWVKDRAKKEYNFYLPKEGHTGATRCALTSVMSDMRKHNETNNPAISAMCLGMISRLRTRDEVFTFIDGFK